MIEQRRMTEEEINRLIKEAPDSEKCNLLEFLDGEISPYEYFNKFSIDQSGILSKGRPIYFAALVPNCDGEKEFFTIANSNIEDLYSLCKISKKTLKNWVEKHGEIYATMEKVSSLNMKWTEWLGFKMNLDSENRITYVIRKRSNVNAND